ncbi:MAG: GC-type dockerin domain-anchored protein, partial [Phycisphaerales bacterium]
STDANTLCPGPVVSCSTGAVFVYDNVAGQLELVQTIVPPDAELYDNFGMSLDVEDDRLVIGSLFTRNPDSGQRTGAVFVYEFDGARWVEIDRVWPPPSVPSEFAQELALSQQTLVVTSGAAKSAEVYTWVDLHGWRHQQTLTQPDPSGPSIGFGVRWAVRDHWFITGGYLDRRGHPSGGAVFIYHRDADGQLELVQEVLADSERMWLGITADFSGDVLLVGAPYASRDRQFEGVVRSYEFVGDRWALSHEVAKDEPGENHQFGSQLFATDDRLIVSASNENTSVSDGTVYLYEKATDGAWVQTSQLIPAVERYAGLYGATLASDGKYLLVGAPHDETAAGEQVGAAYFFDLSCGSCTPDLDLDGSLTIFDFLLFSNLFQDGDPQADFDGDGELTVLDFLAFQTAFDAGC